LADVGAEEARLESVAPGYLPKVRAAAARLGQRASGATDLSAALAAVEELADIDVEVPTESRYPAARRLKAGIKQLVKWYLRYIGGQVSAFGQAVAHLGQLMVQRTEQLEERTGSLERDLAALADRVARLERDRPGP
jgi:hypothetical protein